MSKNKYGYTPSDIAQTIEIRKIFTSLAPQTMKRMSERQDPNSFYGRTEFQGVLRHNDRINSV